MKQKITQKMSAILTIMLLIGLLAPCGILPVQAADDSLPPPSAETHAATGAAIKAGSPVEMPDAFITSVAIYKTITDDTSITFEEEPDIEVARNSKFCIAYSYKILDASAMPEGNAISASVPYTFSIQGKFKDALPFRITSRLPSGNAIKAADGVVNGDKVTLTFTQDAADKGLLDSGVKGTFWFEASFDESQIENNGLQEFEIISAGQTAKTTINFAFNQITAAVPLIKEGVIDLDNKKIKWTLTARPEIMNAKAGDDRLENFVVTDVLPQKLSFVPSSVSVLLTKPGETGSSISVSAIFDPNTSTLTIETAQPLSQVNGAEITITFETSFDPTASDFLTNNKAVFINKADAAYTYPQYKKDTTEGSPTLNQTIDAEPKSETVSSNEKKLEILGSSLDKKGALLDGTNMTWTISVENKLKLENPQIKDTLPSDTSLVAGSVQVDGSIISEGTAATAPSYKKDGNTITFFLKNTASTQVITYHTQFNADWNEKHPDGKVINTAEFYAGPGPGLVLSKTATVPLNSQLMTKNGSYDRTNHTITWKVDIKNTGSGLTNIQLVDTIPDNQEFIDDGTIEAAGSNGFVYDAEKGTITISYPDGYNGWKDTSPDITYKTKLTDDQKSLWGNNLDKAVNVKNTITLTADGLPGKNFTVEGTAPVVSKVLDKKYTSYSFTDKTVSWQLTVNENQMTLTNPVIKDTVPENWEFVQDSVAVRQGSASNISATPFFSQDGKEMTLTLPDMEKDTNAAPYVITYKTHLVDDTLLATNNTIHASNTAELTGDEIVTGGVSVSKSQKIAQAVLEKEGSNANLSEGYLIWNITVNRNLAEIAAPSSGGTVAIQDDLQENLIPLMDSIQVNELIIGTDGKETGRIQLAEDAYHADYDSKTRALVIDLKQQTITKAYQITFHTDVLVSGSYTNSAYFVGMASDKTATSKAVSANFSGGSTTTSYGTVEIIKIDEEGTLLEGAEFELMKDGSSAPEATGTTDSSGILTFPPVRSGQYTLTETKAPDGYDLPESVSQAVTVEKNRTAKITIVNKKTPVPTPTPDSVPTPTPDPVPTPTPDSVPTPTPSQAAGGGGSISTPTKDPEPEPTKLPIPDKIPVPKPATPTATPKPTPKDTPSRTTSPLKDINSGSAGSTGSSTEEDSTVTDGSGSDGDKYNNNTTGRQTESDGTSSGKTGTSDSKTGTASSVPRTGDSSHTILYLILFFLSASLLCILVIVQKKKQNTKDNLTK